jgi:hypothetical protein
MRGRLKEMEAKRIEIDRKDLEALQRTLVGVKDLRHLAFIMLNAVPEERLPELVEYLKGFDGTEGNVNKIDLTLFPTLL